MSLVVMPSRSSMVSKVKFDPVASLNHASASAAMSGTAAMKLLTWSTNRLPKSHRKPARPRPASSMTTPVAMPRRIRRDSRRTAGSIASATNHAMRT